LLKAGILALGVFVLFFSILLSKIYFKAAYLKKLQAKFGLLNQETRELGKDFSKLSLIKNYLNNRFYSLEVLSELHSIAPPELELSDIRYDEKGKFSIRGTADSMSTVASLIENMKKTKYFKDVKRKYATQRHIGSKDLTDFEVSSSVNKNE
jgi:Tfp pilus assembly protein PilN